MTLDPIQGCWIWPRRYREVLTKSWGGYRRQGRLQQDSFHLRSETRQNEDCRVAAGAWSCFWVSWRVSQDLCAPRCATRTSRYTVYALKTRPRLIYWRKGQRFANCASLRCTLGTIKGKLGVRDIVMDSFLGPVARSVVPANYHWLRSIEINTFL